MYIVYIHINKINHKRYIGITSQTLAQRSKNGEGYKTSSHFYHAIQKYGWDNFEHQILYTGLTKEEACKKEVELIKEFNTMNAKYGYNLTTGGEIGAQLSEATLQKKRENMLGDKNPMYGKYGELNHFFGKQHTLETKQIISSKNKGGNNGNAKPIRCINTGIIYPSGREASDWCGIARQNITRCCSGGRPTAGKHPNTGESLKWEYVL